MVLNECTEFSCGLEHPRHEHLVARRLAQGGDDLLPLIEFEANISHVALTYLPLDLVRKLSVDHGRSGGVGWASSIQRGIRQCLSRHRIATYRLQKCACRVR